MELIPFPVIFTRLNNPKSQDSSYNSVLEELNLKNEEEDDEDYKEVLDWMYIDKGMLQNIIISPFIDSKGAKHDKRSVLEIGTQDRRMLIEINESMEDLMNRLSHALTTYHV